MTLDFAIQRSNNNYNLIRLIAAILVIYGHSFILFPSNGYIDPVTIFLKDEYSGSLSVEIFFFLSGIYISHSYSNSTTKLRFCIMRIFRIWPALIICIILTVFLVGPILTNLPLNSYFASTETWKYLIYNSTIAYQTAYTLPGIFLDNFHTRALNGSLWTLPVEVRCYVILFISASLSFFEKPLLLIGVFVAAILLYLTKSEFFSVIMTNTLSIKLLVFFMAGSISYLYKERIIINHKVFIILAGFTIISYLTFFLPAIFYVTMIYGVLVFGVSKVALKFPLPGDYSYGVYIYGFLVQQICQYYLPGITSYPSMFITIPITLVLAIISWYCIEDPAMKFAGKWTKKMNSKVSVNLVNERSHL
jgi:peptidoglycan/LPS O-acetylase OafA/YrhL